MASDMIDLCTSFPPPASELDPSSTQFDHHAHDYVRQLSNLNPQLFLKGVDTPQDILEVLDPSVNTIAYALALDARILSSTDHPKAQKYISDTLKPGGGTWNKLMLFVEQFDPIQIRYVGSSWRRLLEYIDQVARVMNSPGIAISPVRSAMLRADPTTGTFTSIHLMFVRLCMETRSYAAAVPILDNYIHSLPAHIPKHISEQADVSAVNVEDLSSAEYMHSRSGFSDKITTTMLQEYYVLGAMAYIGLRQWKKAMHFLEQILVMPTSLSANGLMLEAYKKWVLVSCLATGQLGVPPRTMHSTAAKQISAASKPYEALATTFSTTAHGEGVQAIKKLKSQVHRGAPYFDDDGNTGLVNELIAAQYNALISSLSWRYSAIPLVLVANMVEASVEDVVSFIEKLVNEGHINARIDGLGDGNSQPVLRFFLDPTQGPLAKTELQQQKALVEQTQRTNVLAEQVRSADYRLSLAKEYVDWSKKQGKKGTAQASGESLETWDSGLEHEEDLMIDLQ